MRPFTSDEDAVRSASIHDGPGDQGLAKRVIRKIDRTIIPLLFITYMFNFMDKIILSSAAVFGLRDDNVSQSSPKNDSIYLYIYISSEPPRSTI
jgi:hypothetical protein